MSLEILKGAPRGGCDSMAYLKIGEKIIYGSQGIMTLADERYESIGDDKKLYYVLSCEDTATSTLTFVPEDNERLCALIKPLLSKQDLSDALDRFDRENAPEWNENARARQDIFKKILEGDDRTEILGIIHLIRESGKRRIAEGKKNFISDENILKRAEKMLSDEIVLVLGVSAEEAMKMIDKAIDK